MISEAIRRAAYQPCLDPNSGITFPSTYSDDCCIAQTIKVSDVYHGSTLHQLIIVAISQARKECNIEVALALAMARERLARVQTSSTEENALANALIRERLLRDLSRLSERSQN